MDEMNHGRCICRECLDSKRKLARALVVEMDEQLRDLLGHDGCEGDAP